GKRQKAKIRSGGREPRGPPSSLLPFAFCLLPFAFRRRRHVATRRAPTAPKSPAHKQTRGRVRHPRSFSFTASAQEFWSRNGTQRACANAARDRILPRQRALSSDDPFD